MGVVEEEEVVVVVVMEVVEGMGVEDMVGMSLNRVNRSWFAMYVDFSRKVSVADECLVAVVDCERGFGRIV